MANAQQCLADTLEAGRLLTEQKAELEHGEWLPWLKENVRVNVRTAQRYMNLHENRNRLKNDSVSHLLEAYDKLVKSKKKQPLQVYTPAKPFVYDGYEYKIKPGYLGGYLVSIDDGEYRNMGETHNHAALLAREAIDVRIGRTDNLDMIRAGGEGMVSFEIILEATEAAKQVKVKPVAPGITNSLSGRVSIYRISIYRVSLLSMELVAFKPLLENAETSELTDMQEQLAKLGNHAEVISALCNERLKRIRTMASQVERQLSAEGLPPENKNCADTASLQKKGRLL